MNGWNDGISRAIAYIEENLTEELDMDEIAARAYVSGFYFQKIFHVLCGFTVGEYIRNRRLTLAAQELCASDVKVIDLAIKYGYDSPDSFTRAFTRFHGVTPSAARKEGCTLNFAAPLKIKLAITGQGQASKEQVAGMLQRMLKISDNDMPKFMDATDALGAAYCHFLQMGRPETDAPHYSSWKDFAIRNRGKASTTDNTLTGPQTKLLGALRKH